MKENDNEHIEDELLTRYLLEEISPAEKRQVSMWINSSSANKQYFEQLKTTWEQSIVRVDVSGIDQDEEWNNFKSRIRQEMPGRASEIPLLSRPYMRIAALFVLFAGVALTFVLLNKRAANSVSYSSGKMILKDRLPDGSGITLNKNSILAYRQSSGKREVDLQGEAFFNITQDKLHPFVIHAGKIAVRVIGTSFNIKTIGEKMEIVVETGAVQVLKGDDLIELIPKEKLTTYGDNGSLTKEKTTDKLYNYYRTRKFECNGTPLRQLVEALNSAYDQHIIIGREEAGNFPITAVFSEQPLNEILRIVCGTLQLTTVKQGNDIILQ